jgi:hypothetical protein
MKFSFKLWRQQRIFTNMIMFHWQSSRDCLSRDSLAMFFSIMHVYRDFFWLSANFLLLQVECREKASERLRYVMSWLSNDIVDFSMISCVLSWPQYHRYDTNYDVMEKSMLPFILLQIMWYQNWESNVISYGLKRHFSTFPTFPDF